MDNLSSENKKELLSLEDALAIKRYEIRDYYRNYINPGLASVLALIDFDKQFTRAHDVSVWDAEGKEYLDFLGGYGALNLGHNPVVVWESIRKVMERPNLLQASLNPLAAALAHNLAKLTPGDLQRVFFCNSGAEAVEGALKLARAYNHERPRILFCNNSFHGKTFGALSVTGRDKYKKYFTPLMPGCEGIAFGDLAMLEEQLSNRDVAAFIVEPIQGEGGVIVPPDGYLSGVRGLCTKYGSLLIADEIQTGFGRTGRLFACEHEQVVPDIMCLAKSLGGGIFPVGAYVSRPKVWDAVYGGMDKYAVHTSTFGGNTMAMAAGIAAVQEIVEQDIPRQAAQKGSYLIEQLKSLQDKNGLIKEIRGKGLLVGLEFEQHIPGILDSISSGKISQLSDEYFGSLVAGDLLNKYQIITAYTLNNPNVIRLEPPLTVSKEAIDKVVGAIGEILEKSVSGVMINSIGSVVKSVFNKLTS